MPSAGHKELRSGFTTGTCAAAAAKGATLMLAHQEVISQVTITLPLGSEAVFQLQGQIFSKTWASCFVIKDAGDDPDITNGAELHAKVTFTPPPFTGEGWGVGEAEIGNNTGYSNPPPTLTLPRQGGGDILITGGSGIGKVTKPGLAVAPGDWAINPVPRKMIADAVKEAFRSSAAHPVLRVEISIPDGEERAKKTLNARLGIIGGLSILGTTGIVRPISAKAWTDTIDASLDVAHACGCTTVVLSTGRTSEMAAQKYLEVPPPLTGGGKGVGEAEIGNNTGYSKLPPTLPRQGGGDIFLPEEAYIMMGDHVDYALRACEIRGFHRPLIACQFAKLLKIACGHENTHAAASELDLATLLNLANTGKFSGKILEIIAKANTAREIITGCSFDPALLELVCREAQAASRKFAPSLKPQFLVADYHENIIFRN
ncbi:MAG TPA: cobalt-precorrin-5B (C(1))-methyltransferase CbiD [Desulfuromonadaceae bacterium]